MLHHARVLSSPGRRRGFTIVEVVMACIIIGILTIALVPVLTSQANNARITSAKSDCENLSAAQERAAVDTGYIYRPFMLNDVKLGDGVANAPMNWPPVPGDLADRINGVRDNVIADNTNLYGQFNPTWIFISPSTQQFLQQGMQNTLFERLTGQNATGGATTVDLERNPDAEEQFHWGGPYITWRRDANHNDWPDDPWGNDYLFFTRWGVMFPPTIHSQTGGSTGGGTGGTTGNTNNQGTYDPAADYSYAFFQYGPIYTINGVQVQFPACAQPTAGGGSATLTEVPMFDRPTWLSVGPDGIPGSVSKVAGANFGKIDPQDPASYGYGKGDDIFYSFGGN